MPVTKTCEIEQLSDRNYKLSWSDPLTTTIRDILSTPNPFFTESQVTVVERLVINCIVNDFNIVDADYNWPDIHYYIGNYQLASWEGGYSGVTTNEGYIVRTTTVIEKFSTITIAADPNRLATIGSNLRIEQCNLQLVPVLKIVPPAITPVVSYQVAPPDPVLEGFIQRVPSQLQAQVYQPRISGAKIGLRPGCELFSGLYSIAPVNNVFVADPAYILPTCTLPGGCDAEFDAFVLANNNNQPIDTPQGFIYSSNSGCQVLSGQNNQIQQCNEQIFGCSNGDSRPYWTPTLN